MPSRKEFEAWITGPPYERSIERLPSTSAWQGQYRRSEVQIAWEAANHFEQKASAMAVRQAAFEEDDAHDR